MLGHDFASSTPFSLCLFFPLPAFVLPILDSRRRVSHSCFSLFLRSNAPRPTYPLLPPSLFACFSVSWNQLLPRARICRTRRSERNNRVSERDEKYYGRLGQETRRGRRRARKASNGRIERVCWCESRGNGTGKRGRSDAWCTSERRTEPGERKAFEARTTEGMRRGERRGQRENGYEIAVERR